MDLPTVFPTSAPSGTKDSTSPDKGPRMMAVMWVGLLFVGVSVVSAVHCRQIRRDAGRRLSLVWDWLVVWSFVLPLLFWEAGKKNMLTAFKIFAVTSVVLFSVSAGHGMGKPQSQLSQYQAVTSVKLCFIANIFAVSAQSLPNIAIATHLVARYTPLCRRYNKWLLAFYGLVISQSALAAVGIGLVFSQQTPVESLWDPTIPSSSRPANVMTVFSIFAAAYTAATEFLLAGVFIYFTLSFQGVDSRIFLHLPTVLIIAAGVLALVNIDNLHELDDIRDFTYTTVTFFILTFVQTALIIVASTLNFITPMGDWIKRNFGGLSCLCCKYDEDPQQNSISTQQQPLNPAADQELKKLYEKDETNVQLKGKRYKVSCYPEGSVDEEYEKAMERSKLGKQKEAARKTNIVKVMRPVASKHDKSAEGDESSKLLDDIEDDGSEHAQSAEEDGSPKHTKPTALITPAEVNSSAETARPSSLAGPSSAAGPSSLAAPTTLAEASSSAEMAGPSSPSGAPKQKMSKAKRKREGRKARKEERKELKKKKKKQEKKEGEEEEEEEEEEVEMEEVELEMPPERSPEETAEMWREVAAGRAIMMTTEVKVTYEDNPDYHPTPPVVTQRRVAGQNGIPAARPIVIPHLSRGDAGASTGIDASASLQADTITPMGGAADGASSKTHSDIGGEEPVQPASVLESQSFGSSPGHGGSRRASRG